MIQFSSALFSVHRQQRSRGMGTSPYAAPTEFRASIDGQFESARDRSSASSSVAMTEESALLTSPCTYEVRRFLRHRGVHKGRNNVRHTDDTLDRLTMQNSSHSFLRISADRRYAPCERSGFSDAGNAACFAERYGTVPLLMCRSSEIALTPYVE